MPQLSPRPARTSACTLLTLSLSLLGVPMMLGCGNEGAGDEPAAASPADVSLVDAGPASGVYEIEGERTVPSGAVRFTIDNPAAKERGAQIIRVQGDHDAAEAFAALNEVREGAPLPGWLKETGGIGVIRPQQRQVFTVELRPGRYYVVDRSYEGKASELATFESAARLEVTQGEQTAPPAPASASITATEYRFAARGLAAGSNTVRLENKGMEPHDFVLSPILAGKTLEDVKSFAEDESGPPPVDFEREVISGVLAAGTTQTMRLDLQAGTYALLCFATDRAGGPPHVAKGMVSETTVE